MGLGFVEGAEGFFSPAETALLSLWRDVMALCAFFPVGFRGLCSFEWQNSF